MGEKNGVLLIQLGTPDSPKISDVRKYLSEFLNDERVIDIPWLARKILVNLIIVPFRAPKSAKIYRELWTEKGSPLLFYSESLKKKVQNVLPDNYDVYLAMRYQNPSMESVLAQMKKKQYDEIIIFPLFPQYASATSGSAIEKAVGIIKNWWVIPQLKIVSHFYEDENFINSFVQRASKFNFDEYDHVLFSFHGLPNRQVDKVYEDGKPCSDHDCELKITEENKFCYKAQCYATTRLISERLNIPESKFSVCFQSRLNKDWLEPFADKTLIKLAESGIKKVLVFSPAFVADCLETLIEIGSEYQSLFKSHGGEKVQLVESLNDNDDWVDGLAKIILSK